MDKNNDKGQDQQRQRGAYLTVYLNDHRAGATVALELMTHLEKDAANYGSVAPEESLRAFFTKLRADIEADSQELEAIMERLGVTESRPRQAAAWFSEKMARLKLKMDDHGDGALRLLESLDVLASGIEGKRALWTALAAASEGTPPVLPATDWTRLIARAVEQHDRVEALRLQAARAAFAPAQT